MEQSHCNSVLISISGWAVLTLLGSAKLAYNEEHRNCPQAALAAIYRVGLRLHSSGKRLFSDLEVACFFSLLKVLFHCIQFERPSNGCSLKYFYSMGKLIYDIQPSLISQEMLNYIDLNLLARLQFESDALVAQSVSD